VSENAIDLADLSAKWVRFGDKSLCTSPANAGAYSSTSNSPVLITDGHTPIKRLFFDPRCTRAPSGTHEGRIKHNPIIVLHEVVPVSNRIADLDLEASHAHTRRVVALRGSTPIEV
jgi:hypothetical protein